VDLHMNWTHIPVLLEEAVAMLNPRPKALFVDATLGGGGHAKRLCDFLDGTNTVLGIDQDPVALDIAAKTLSGCKAGIKLIRGNFAEIGQILAKAGYGAVDGGILLDLGVSDFQLKAPERGFSFQQDAPLDMRMDPEQRLSAYDLVNTVSPEELAGILYRYGDEKLSRPIAAAVINARPVETTAQLARIVSRVYRQKGIRQKIHPATRVFQALRIAVNDELACLDRFLAQLPDILAPGARVAIITFHSLEDRRVKQVFRKESAHCICPPKQPVCTCNHRPTLRVLGKPLTSSADEIRQNPQARSAKLRVAERLG
jgi:16S rRNA (cytosine1402-N4)-methyltransferase